MPKHIYAAIFVFSLYSCIPFQLAPSIEDYKLVNGKRFKKGLPKKTTFVFEDPKTHGEFYDYINIKYQLNDDFVDVEVPFEVNGSTFYFSFYEVVKKSKALFLLPLVTDVALNAATDAEQFEPVVSSNDNSILKADTFYIVIEVYSDSEKDCLRQSYSNSNEVLTYLQNLKSEYLNTYNYHEVLFKN